MLFLKSGKKEKISGVFVSSNSNWQYEKLLDFKVKGIKCEVLGKIKLKCKIGMLYNIKVLNKIIIIITHKYRRTFNTTDLWESPQADRMKVNNANADT